METTHALCVVMPFIQPPAALEIELTSVLYKVVSQYKPLVWGIALCEAGLLYSFPNLVFDIVKNGFSNPTKEQ